MSLCPVDTEMINVYMDDSVMVSKGGPFQVSPEDTLVNIKVSRWEEDILVNIKVSTIFRVERIEKRIRCPSYRKLKFVLIKDINVIIDGT